MKCSEYKTILSMAVENEVEAFEFYSAAEKKVKSESLKSIFKELAAEEVKHKQILEGYLENDMQDMEFDESVDYKISETVPLPKLSTDMNYTDAIGLAMKKEQEAMEMYDNFAKASADQDQKKTFLELAKMEKSHKTRLEEIYNSVAFVEVW